MLLLLFFLFSQRAGTCALPILPPSPLEAPGHDPAFDMATTASTGACAGRSLWDILWSCLATTFACTWVSVHPNIPFLREDKASTRSWRIYLTLVSLFAPEIMILWASKQWAGAYVIMRTVNYSYKDYNFLSGSQDADRVRNPIHASKQKEKDNSLLWTLTHAQYFQMGGYRLQCLPSEEVSFPSRYGRHAKAMFERGERDVWELPLSFETMKKACNNGRIDIPFIPKDEILEKNGRDALSRTIAMLQLTWFIIQIAARIRQNLAITEIELTTAVLASLNIVMYIFWWSKPTDILCPTIIRTKALQDQDLRWMPRSSPPQMTDIADTAPQSTQHTDEACASSPPPEPAIHYVIAHVGDIGDIERHTFATHYWHEFTKALRGSLILIAKAPATLVTGIFGLALEFGVQIRGIWAGPSCRNSASYHKSSSHHNSATYDSHSQADLSSPSKSCKTTSLATFTAKFQETMYSIWRTVTHPFQALVYYPTLAILQNGRKQMLKTRLNTDSGSEKHKIITVKDVEDKTTIQLIFNKHALCFVLDMIFFCEDTVNAPFAFLSAFSGAIFGMIHCLAWNFEFPSHVEQILWRTSSSIIAGLYVCIMVIALGFVSFKKFMYHRAMPTVREASLFGSRSFDINEMARGVLSACFVLTRLSLLTLSIIQLRSLPTSASDTVEWSGFIPHI